MHNHVNSVRDAASAPREFKDSSGAVLFILAQVAFFGSWKLGLLEDNLPQDPKDRCAR